MPKPSLSYSDLRRAAEAASGTRDSDVYVEVEPRRGGSEPGETIIIVHDKRPPDREESVVVHARTSGSVRRSVVKHAQVSPNPDGSEPFDLTAVGADSVFWSDGAVEKFLVPYYASVHGGNAVQWVGKLLQVWRMEKLEQQADVFALAHLPKSDYVSNLLVLFSLPGEMEPRGLPLEEFLELYQATAP